MISKIINGAACLGELASNPKSFSNCSDLHGGVPLEENGVASKLRKSSPATRRGEQALGKLSWAFNIQPSVT